jgi:hypothetical protein
MKASDRLKEIEDGFRSGGLAYAGDKEWLINRVKKLTEALEKSCICWKLCPRKGENPHPKTCNACKALEGEE